jgi:hypothetical protein
MDRDPYATRKASKSDSSGGTGALHRMHLYVFISVEIHTSLREVQLPVLTGLDYELTRLT